MTNGIYFDHLASRAFLGQGQNFITDEIIGYGFIDNSKIVAFELSTGVFRFPEEEPVVLWGITLRKLNEQGDKWERMDYELNKSFKSREEADEYIADLMENL